jgi:chromosome segregation ATPase
MIDILAVTILAFLFAYVCWDIGRDGIFMDLFSRKTDIQTRLSAVNQIKTEPDVSCATKLAMDKGVSTPSGDDLNQQIGLPLMAKDDDQNLTVLENERLKNELSLLQSQLTDSSSKLEMFQNVHDELATTKGELEYSKRVITEISELNLRLTYEELEKERLANELSQVQSQLTDSHSKVRQFHIKLETTKSELKEKKRLITDIKKKNLRLTNQDSRLRREIEDRNRLIAFSQAEVEKLRVSLNNHTDTIEQLLDPRNDEEVDLKVEKPNEIPVAIQHVETIQNNLESLKFQPLEAVLTIESLSKEIAVENQEDIPVEEHPSNQQLGMDETKPECLSESLSETIVDTENVTNEDPVGDIKLLEIAEETIIASPKGEANNRIRRKKKAMSLCMSVCMSRSIARAFYDRFRTFWS